MGMLDLAELQRTGQRIDRGDRWADRAALFQADVPVDADAGEFGHFLAPKSGRASPAPSR
jgi:hypothetical protein